MCFYIALLRSLDVTCVMGACAMPQSHIDDPQKLDDPQKPKDLPRPCAVCGFPMFLSLVQPSDRAGYDRRTFVCAKCGNSETVTVKFR
jgi:hypothetical protein